MHTLGRAGKRRVYLVTVVGLLTTFPLFWILVKWSYLEFVLATLLWTAAFRCECVGVDDTVRLGTEKSPAAVARDLRGPNAPPLLLYRAMADTVDHEESTLRYGLSLFGREKTVHCDFQERDGNVVIEMYKGGHHHATYRMSVAPRDDGGCTLVVTGFQSRLTVPDACICWMQEGLSERLLALHGYHPETERQLHLPFGGGRGRSGSGE